jgi:hypothetical protein
MPTTANPPIAQRVANPPPQPTLKIAAADRQAVDRSSNDNAVVKEVSLRPMREFTWSPAEKKAARSAFDLALSREIKATRQEAEAMLRHSSDDRVIWRLRDYLEEKRREIDQKYDYRYSVLMWVFPRLVSEGWLKMDELAGIGTEKVDVINKSMSLRER